MKRAEIFLIKLYKNYLSKLLSVFIVSECRFYPTCSEYSCLAIEKYGVVKGSILSIKRIVRCNPFCDSGFDPIANK